MKTKLLLSVLLSFFFYLLSSQVPQGINYQALAGDASGNPIRNTDLQAKICILSDTIQPVTVWEELHSIIRTNSQGIFSLVIGSGVRQSSSSAAAFNEIDWSATPLFIKTQIYCQGTWRNMGSAKLWSVPYAMVAENLSGTLKKLAVTGETANMDEALFEVKNKNGQIVFAVYNEGVRIYVDDGAKGAKGGFAIGGFGGTKTPAQNYFVVKPDTIRMYIDNTPGKGAKGGFAIGGFGGTKAAPQNFFVVKSDTVRIYIDDTPGKSAKGGFAIGGFGSTKGISQKLLTVSPDSIRMYIDAQTKGAKGGFAIGGFGGTKGNNNSFLDVATDATGIINPSQNRILWYPLKNAFLAGKVLIENPDSVGENSLAIGYESKAIGQFSQALGYKAIARGDYATAIGKGALANLINSFAFGENAHANREESYAFGRGAIADGFRSFAFGSAGVDSVGQITGVAYAKGFGSFALGMGSQALGDQSFAIGIADTAIGGTSFAFGLGTCSTGWGATSMGMQTKASGHFSTSMGYKTIASNWVDMAIGNGTIASGGGSFAGGYGCIATGDNSISYGTLNLASGSKSVALGNKTAATSWHSFAMGHGSQSSGDASAAFGSYNTASGNNSTAFGDSTESSGPMSVTFGYKTKASVWTAMAIGAQTVAYGESSFATGSFSKANGWASAAFGFQSHVNSNISAVFGYGTIANSYSSVVLGTYNDTTNMTNSNWFGWTDPAFVVGNGTSDTDRKNAFTVLQNSNVGINMVNPQEKLDIVGGNGRVESGYGWLTSSDIRFKRNITTLESSLEKVLNLRGVRYDIVKDPESPDTPGKNIGFIAQELEKVVPEVVVTGSDGYKSVAYDKLTAVLTEAIKEQQKQIESQQKKIDELTTLVNTFIANQSSRGSN